MSGFLITVRYGKYVRVTQCAYERIYYDSEFGQLKDTYPKWEGLYNNSLKLSKSKEIADNIKGKDTSALNSADNLIENAKVTIGNANYEFKGVSYQPYINNMTKVFKELDKLAEGDNLCYDDSGNTKLFYYNGRPSDPNSLLGKFMNDIDKLMNPILELTEETKEVLLDISESPDYYSEQLNNSFNSYESISEDLKNYQNGYLDEVEHYVKIANRCGYTLVIIYLCLFSFIAIGGCILLLAYTYLTNQGYLDKFMHLVWNTVKFFSFSFFIYGAAFGMLFNGLRDLIAYNQFLFGDNLIADKTYLLPKGKSKDFLFFCLNETNAEYTVDLDFTVSETLDVVETNIEEMESIIEDKTQKNLIGYSDSYNVFKCSRQRNLEDSSGEQESEEESQEESSSDSPEKIHFPIEIVESIINFMKEKLEEYKKLIQKNSGNRNLANKNSGNAGLLGSFDCGFLKNDLNILYNSLYDLSVESRILCVLSCLMGFFSEIFVNFYLLSMYHYSQIEFKDGNSGKNRGKYRSKIINKNIDLSSKNEFLDKTKPLDMKKYNKELDIDFSS